MTAQAQTQSRAAEHTIRLTVAEWQALPEYSSSIPTGTTAGKRWRRHHRWIDGGERNPWTGAVTGGVVRESWWVGEYGQPFKMAGERDLQVPITWYRVIIRAPSRPRS